MSRIFLSHSSANNAEAVAIRDWLKREGWRFPDGRFGDNVRSGGNVHGGQLISGVPPQPDIDKCDWHVADTVPALPTQTVRCIFALSRIRWAKYAVRSSPPDINEGPAMSAPIPRRPST